MNTQNLNTMADYFDNGTMCDELNMRQYCRCALGHSIRVLDKKYGTWDTDWVQGSARRLFGFDEGDPEGQFLFKSSWINNRYAAAARFRYIALHGGAPSSDQLERFQFPPRVVETEDVAVEEELACV